MASSGESPAFFFLLYELKESSKYSTASFSVEKFFPNILH